MSIHRQLRMKGSHASQIAERLSTSTCGVANRSIGEYLIQRLHDYGVQDVFGIPGDYVLAFYSMLEQSRCA